MLPSQLPWRLRAQQIGEGKSGDGLGGRYSPQRDLPPRSCEKPTEEAGLVPPQWPSRKCREGIDKDARIEKGHDR